MRDAPDRRLTDVILFVALLTAHIWIVIPMRPTGEILKNLLPTCAIVLAVVSLWRNGFTLRRVGIRVDNLARSLAIFAGIGVTYAVVTIWLFSFENPLGTFRIDARSAIGMYGWALLQEFLLLAYLLQRFTQVMASRLWAAGAAATVFAFFHSPNPFLTVYTLLGGWIVALVYQRYPNLLAAALGHVAASALVSQLLPGELTGWMKVGPGYLYRAFERFG